MPQHCVGRLLGLGCLGGSGEVEEGAAPAGRIEGGEDGAVCQAAEGGEEGDQVGLVGCKGEVAAAGWAAERREDESAAGEGGRAKSCDRWV